jgi:hypothetical protein
MLRTVKGWIDIAGVDYARQSLSKSGVDDPYINAIIEAALRRSGFNHPQES